MPSVTRNYLIAGALALGVALWMLTGLWWGGAAPEAGVAGAPPADEGPLLTVEVSVVRGQPIERRIVAQGQVRPERSATLRAQTAGQVESVAVDAGQAVQPGDVLVQLALDDRPARLREARAVLQQRKREYEAARHLGATGLQSKVRQDEAAAALESARANVERIQLDIEHTRIRAPFAGIVDQRLVDVGDYAARESPVVTLVDNDPLTAVAFLSQRHFDAVRVGAPARVTLVSGEVRTGRVNAVAPRADEASRTFRVEVDVPNPGGVPANTSAEIDIPIETVIAHRISPALLTLDGDGALGVKTVDTHDRVAFAPVEIVRSDARGLWVTGLSESARVITAGGGFVTPGEAVDVVPSTGPAAS